MLTETIGFDKILEEMKIQREQRCFKHNGDLVISICGPEGSGKSLFALALACAIDPSFTGKHVYYDWESYVAANLGCISQRMGGMDPAMLGKYNDYGIDLSEVSKVEADTTIKQGSVLLYDEAGVGMFNRSAMSQGNVEQVRMFISNRFLNLVHILCVPTPNSIDKYIREQRTKFLIWVECMGSIFEPDRVMFLYSRQNYTRLLNQDGWWKLFNTGASLMCKVVHPEYRVVLPDLTRPWGDRVFIPAQIYEEYHARKSLYHFKQTKEMLEPQGEGSGPKQIDHTARIVSLGEDQLSWVKRTGLHPRDYYQYGGTRKRQRQLKREDKAAKKAEPGLKLSGGPSPILS
jgi:hypothetical protein